jgi:excisionase family DNA binding protein
MKTVPEVSQDTGIPETTLRSAIGQGRLKATKIGRDWLIDETAPDYQLYINSYRQRPRIKKVKNREV